jgi:hypothetical protein
VICLPAWIAAASPALPRFAPQSLILLPRFQLLQSIKALGLGLRQG